MTASRSHGENRPFEAGVGARPAPVHRAGTLTAPVALGGGGATGGLFRLVTKVRESWGFWH